ncbi:hypothetical protein HU734_010430 [Pseudomonas wayambapalatensis]|uniref:hypothetical protein n=1 Tax=Pseudomonas sp. L7 TaxID=3388343 RepID=UPI0016479C5D|nr:hypothetical protein HU734_010430 [Pseudomonas wayambapalatensis]
MEIMEIYKDVVGALPPTEIIAAIAAIAASASALFAAITIISTARARSNERLLEHAIETLERAYSSLVGNSQDGKIPVADRLAWLTSARLIEEYKSAKKRISSALIRQECESHEEHWRHQFYLKLKNLSGGDINYYSKNGSIECINPVSAVIIHAFADWPEGKKDPLRKYRDEKDAVAKLKPMARWFILHQYCGTLPNPHGTGRSR